MRIELALNFDNFLVYWLQFIIHNPIRLRSPSIWPQTEALGLLP